MIYAGIAAVFAGAIAVWLCRPDLLQRTWLGGLLFLAFYTVFLLGLKWSAPGYLEEVWNLRALSGVLVYGLPSKSSFSVCPSACIGPAPPHPAEDRLGGGHRPDRRAFRWCSSPSSDCRISSAARWCERHRASTRSVAIGQHLHGALVRARPRRPPAPTSAVAPRQVLCPEGIVARGQARPGQQGEGGAKCSARRLIVPDAYFVQLVVGAARRGVDVRVLTNGAQTDIKSTWLAGRSRYQTLLTAGVRI